MAGDFHYYPCAVGAMQTKQLKKIKSIQLNASIMTSINSSTSPIKDFGLLLRLTFIRGAARIRGTKNNNFQCHALRAYITGP